MPAIKLTINITNTSKPKKQTVKHKPQNATPNIRLILSANNSKYKPTKNKINQNPHQ